MELPTGRALRIAVVLVAVETLALVGYAVAIGIASRNSRGSSVTATGWEIATYLAFAILLGLICFGLLRQSAMARTPFLMAQVFIGIVGYTVFSGDGTGVKVAGVLLLMAAAVGVWVGFSPGLVSELEQPPGK